MNLSKISIVLDHPDEPRNIGAACRAMANSDIKDLRIVGKKEDYDVEKVHILAIHAACIFDNARFYNNINEATADCALSAGTTRRRGKNRGRLILPEEFAREADLVTGEPEGQTLAALGVTSSGEQTSSAAGVTSSAALGVSSPAAIGVAGQEGQISKAEGGRVAIVFGNERTGLTDDQLDMCTLGVTIPTSDEFGSLNLSHAVQILCYHMFRQNLENNHKDYRGYTPVTLERIDGAVKCVTDNLQKVGFFKMPGREDMEEYWRSLLARASLSEGEVQYLEKIFTKMSGLASKNHKSDE
ncbi:MAG: RNA methyltransferase [Spirochaetia bacterium]|nr:RNA methyltransferase [Spirochaetia bacterium]